MLLEKDPRWSHQKQGPVGSSKEAIRTARMVAAVRLKTDATNSLRGERGGGRGCIMIGCREEG